MGKRARERAEERFDERRVVSRVLDVYGELLTRRQEGRNTARPGGPA
jgi:hypothetical protein